MIGSIIGFIVVALIAGFAARAIKPGKDPMSVPQTLALGAVGSFVGGFLGRLVGGDSGAAAGVFGSIVGAVIVLLLWTKFGKNLVKR